MKKLFSFIILFLSITTYGQVNKAWVDSEAKLVNPAFDPANARYFINNKICERATLNQSLKNWSADQVTGIDVQSIGNHPGIQPVWIISISGMADPSKKEIINCPSKYKIKNECNDKKE